jgi:cell division protein FtsB
LQRNSTCKKRDGENENIKAELTILKNEIEGLKSLDLASKLAQIQTDIEWIKEKLR